MDIPMPRASERVAVEEIPSSKVAEHWLCLAGVVVKRHLRQRRNQVRW